jgi:hypothetical protein
MNKCPFWYAFIPLLVCIGSNRGRFRVPFVVRRVLQVLMHAPPSPLYMVVVLWETWFFLARARIKTPLPKKPITLLIHGL